MLQCQALVELLQKNQVYGWKKNTNVEIKKVVSKYENYIKEKDRKKLDSKVVEFSVLTKELISITGLTEEYEEISIELQEWK